MIKVARTSNVFQIRSITSRSNTKKSPVTAAQVKELLLKDPDFIHKVTGDFNKPSTIELINKIISNPNIKRLPADFPMKEVREAFNKDYGSKAQKFHKDNKGRVDGEYAPDQIFERTYLRTLTYIIDCLG